MWREINKIEIKIEDILEELVGEIFGKGVDDGGDFYFIDIVGGIMYHKYWQS